MPGQPRGARRRRTVAALGAAAVLMLAACSDDQQDELSETVGSIAEGVGDAAESIVSNAQDAAGEVIDDAAELAARNLAAEQGEQQFDEAGYPLDEEGLACEATVTDDATALDINCSGLTEDGGAAALAGTTTEIPGASLSELEGDFVGTVDGGEVFTTDRLGG